MIDNLGYVRPNEVMQGHCSDFCLEASEFNRVYWSINLRSAYYRPPTLFMGKLPAVHKCIHQFVVKGYAECLWSPSGTNSIILMRQ